MNVDLSALDMSETSLDSENSHRTIYLSLREVITKHIANEEESILSLCKSPVDAQKWRPTNDSACTTNVRDFENVEDMNLTKENSNENAMKMNFEENLEMTM